jgi:hypothetical protein
MYPVLLGKNRGIIPAALDWNVYLAARFEPHTKQTRKQA